MYLCYEKEVSKILASRIMYISRYELSKLVETFERGKFTESGMSIGGGYMQKHSENHFLQGKRKGRMLQIFSMKPEVISFWFYEYS